MGGGLAGLALVAELSAPEFSHLSIIVIEQRGEYLRDKTWSYWRQSPHSFSDCENAAWPAWRVHDATNSITVDSSKAENYVYASIASDVFYRAVLSKINACSHIELLQGERLQSIRTESGRAIVTLKSASNIVVSQFLFDSRPPEKTSKQHLYQHFLSLEMVADKSIFDTSYVDLMDFQASDHGLHFMHVLPYSSTRALIKSTWICHHVDHADRAGYTQELNDYLIRRWPNAKFELVYTEAASVSLEAQKVHKKWLGQTQLVPIGSSTGATLGAISDAFLEALQDAKRLAYLIKTKEPLTRFNHNKIDARIDTLFVSFLQKNSRFGSHTYVRIFSNCAPASLIRFLTGQANWRDRLAVIRSIL